MWRLGKEGTVSGKEADAGRGGEKEPKINIGLPLKFATDQVFLRHVKTCMKNTKDICPLQISHVNKVT